MTSWDALDPGRAAIVAGATGSAEVPRSHGPPATGRIPDLGNPVGVDSQERSDTEAEVMDTHKLESHILNPRLCSKL
jgi:hypothetical protein